MLFRVGTVQDLEQLPASTSTAVIEYVSQNVRILDAEYGKDRNVDRDDGGYCLYAQNDYDVHLMYAAVDMNNHPYEWLDVLSDGIHCAALFLLSNDYAIVCIMPVSRLPKAMENDYI